MSQALQITEDDIKDAQIRVLEGEVVFLKGELIQAVATARALSQLLSDKEEATTKSDEIPPSPS